MWGAKLIDATPLPPSFSSQVEIDQRSICVSKVCPELPSSCVCVCVCVCVFIVLSCSFFKQFEQARQDHTPVLV